MTRVLVWKLSLLVSGDTAMHQPPKRLTESVIDHWLASMEAQFHGSRRILVLHEFTDLDYFGMEIANCSNRKHRCILHASIRKRQPAINRLVTGDYIRLYDITPNSYASELFLLWC